MAKNDEELVALWNESSAISDTDGTLQYIVFAKRVRDKTLLEACSLVCFYCRDDVPLHKSMSGDWKHVFFGEDKKRVLDRVECKATAIREIM